MVNELERKLRKLLYLAASISDNEKAKGSINQLEEKNFGEIFDLLFIDQNFIRDIKKRINADDKGEFNGRSKYSKEEIKTYLNSLIEHTLWDTILCGKDVPTLRTRFRDVQSYRNDVMHAHNIGKELFGKARYLFDKINKELDIAIGKLIGDTEESSVEQKSKVNMAISYAIAAAKISALSEAYKNMTISPSLLEMSAQLSKAIETLPPLDTNIALTKRIKDIPSAIQPYVGSTEQA